MFGKEQFIQSMVRVFRERFLIFVCVSFRLGFEGGMWDFIVLVPDHCHSFYFLCFYAFHNLT